MPPFIQFVHHIMAQLAIDACYKKSHTLVSIPCMLCRFPMHYTIVSGPLQHSILFHPGAFLLSGLRPLDLSGI